MQSLLRDQVLPGVISHIQSQEVTTGIKNI